MFENLTTPEIKQFARDISLIHSGFERDLGWLNSGNEWEERNELFAKHIRKRCWEAQKLQCSRGGWE